MKMIYISIVKPTRSNLSQIYFLLLWSNALHISEGLSVHHQDFKAVYTAISICQKDTAVCLLDRYCCLLAS